MYKVKSLTEERENLTIDFKDENNELKNKIKALERELLVANEYRSSSLNRLRSDTSTDGDGKHTIHINFILNDYK